MFHLILLVPITYSSADLHIITGFPPVFSSMCVCVAGGEGVTLVMLYDLEVCIPILTLLVTFKVEILLFHQSNELGQCDSILKDALTFCGLKNYDIIVTKRMTRC